MDRKKNNIIARNLTIVSAYGKLRDTKEHGVPKYTHAWICAKLAKEFFLSEDTIERIVAKGANPA